MKLTCMDPQPHNFRMNGNGLEYMKPCLAVRQALRVMKLLIILLTVVSLHVSAKGHTQKVTLSLKEVPVEKVFREIQKQTGLGFFYTRQMLNGARPVTIEVKNERLEEALRICFLHQPFSFNLVNNNIVISEKPGYNNNHGGMVDPKALLFDVKGKIVNEKGEPMAGASVQVKGDKFRGIYSDENGFFELKGVDENTILIISSVNIETREIKIGAKSELLLISVKMNVISVEAVEILSTGYYKVPKERTTGSFLQINEELIERRVSTNIIDRLEDITSGLIFNRGAGSAAEPISIRGRTTIFANTSPLIVVDNFPYDGPLENINPNDVESITILKDAAAASIWGARAGNGVIVINTKKGKFNSKMQISYNSNVTIGAKPDLYYVPQMGIGEFIEIEKWLFSQNYYLSTELSASKTKLSPVVETLIKQRDGLISSTEASRLIDEYKTRDVRRNMGNYYNRNSINQQHSLSIRGGSSRHQYSVSAGFDRNLSNLVGSRFERITLNALNNWTLLNNKLELSVGLYLARNGSFSDTRRPLTHPYDRLADDEGNPLQITGTYSDRYINSLSNNKLLDWAYVPLNDRGLQINDTRYQDIRVTTSAGYHLLPGLKAEVLYQYWSNEQNNNVHYPVESYFARDMINKFTQVNTDGSLLKVVPEGGILSLNNTQSESHSLRGQVSYFKELGAHSFSGLGGYEVKDLGRLSNGVTYYGYNDKLGLSQPVDNITRFRYYYNSGTLSAIPSGITHDGIIDRFISYYGNAAYTYRNKYSVTFSTRKDQSNLFGVDANQRGVPLWSAGFGWNISKEGFYQLDWLPLLKLRTTYGYNGNVHKNLSAYTTAAYALAASSSLVPGLLIANVINPPNPSLRWERIRAVNVGLDFEFTKRKFYGSIEWYSKKGMDLIGTTPIASSTGMTQFMGNVANTINNGVDLMFNSKNINGKFSWHTQVLFSYIREKVLSYEFRSTVSNYLSVGSGMVVPLEGKPLFSVYSYEWAGLDPQNGNPMGYLDNVVSSNYNQIMNAATPDNILYHGPVRPTHFGAVRNDFSWRSISLSVNASYRFGHYFRRASIDYFNLLRGQIQHGDFANRWLQPGDEKRTNIPSLPATTNAGINSPRHLFYSNSSVLVEKGDHIRLQDIRLSYKLDAKVIRRLLVKQIEFYGYANNLGIIWKATKIDIDPDYLTNPPIRSFAFGCRIDF